MPPDEPTASTGDPPAPSPRAERDATADPMPGATVAGRYRVLGVIGEGGFGLVYEAEQIAPVRRRVALKILKPGMDSRAILARFEAERQALAVMDHPCIAKVLEAGETDRGLPFFVMELVRGSPITDYCDRQRLTIAQRLGLFAQVCDAIQHAHTKAIIHRDIKPSNILVEVREGAEPTPKVIDFGIAKAMAQKLTEKTLFTERGQLIGTPEYMSPEQAEMGGEDIDTRSDVYSLGVLLYELLTGERPFDLKRAALFEIQRVIREVEPPKPSTRLTGLGETATRIAECRRTDLRTLSGTLKRELEWIPLKALRKDRTERYRTAADLGDDVRRYISGEALEAGPPSASYRLRKFVRRNRGPVAAVLAVFAVLVLGIAGTGYGLISARIQEQKVRASQRDTLASLLSLIRSGANILGPEKISAIASDAGLGIRLADLRENRDRIQQTGIEFPENYGNYDVLLETMDGDPAAFADLRTGVNSLASLANEVVENLGNALHEANRARDAAELARKTVEYNSYVANVQMAQASLEMQMFERVLPRLEAAPLSYRNWEWFWIDARAERSLARLGGHSGPVLWASFSEDGRHVFTVSEDGIARVWDALTGEALSEQAVRHTSGALSASFSPDGTRIVTASAADETARLWDAATGDLLAELRGFTGSFSADGSRIVTASLDGTARVWEAKTGEPIAEILGNKNLIIASLSPNGHRAVTATAENIARLWDLESGSLLTELTGHTDLVSSASFSPDNTRIVTASIDGAARVWEAATGELLLELWGHTNFIFAASFCPHGTRIVTASADGTARVWDAATGESLADLLGHTAWVNTATFSPDGTKIVTSSDDATARVWDATADASLVKLSVGATIVSSDLLRASNRMAWALR
jgi:WD40 repeat protein/serine/threonine protein kinase